MGHIILLLRVLSDGMMIAATIYARIPEPPRKHTSAHARRIKVGSRSKYSAMPAQTPHSMRLDSLRYYFLPFIVKSPFLYIIRCFADFVKLHLDPVYLEEQGRPRICSAGRCGRCRRRSRSGRARSRADRTAFRYRSGCHTAPCRCRPR